MNIKKLAAVGSMVCLMFGIGMLRGQNDVALKPVKVADNLHALQGLGGNVAVCVGERGVLIVDAGTLPRDGEKIVRAVAGISNTPIAHLVLTHYHFDHVGGQQSFPGTVRRIGHLNLAANMAEHGMAMIRHYTEGIYPNYIENFKKRLAHMTDKEQLATAEKQLTGVIAYVEEMKEIKAPALDATFSERMVIDLGGIEAEVVYPGPAHTDGNCVVYFPQLKILHTGDLVFNGSIPFIDGPAGGDTRNWIDFLKRVVAGWDVSTVIPGHGPVTDKKGIVSAVEVLEAMRSAVAAGMKEGKSMEEMQQSLEIPRLKDMPGRDFLPGNIAAIYSELKGDK